MIEVLRVDQWLYATLTGDATLAAAVGTRCYGDVAPQGAVFPYLLFTLMDGTDVMGVGTARIMVNAIYQIKVIGQGPSYGPLKAIADRMDTVLQGKTGSVVDGVILACTREQPIRYVEVAGETQYRHLGGLYRIFVQ